MLPLSSLMRDNTPKTVPCNGVVCITSQTMAITVKHTQTVWKVAQLQVMAELCTFAHQHGMPCISAFAH